MSWQCMVYGFIECDNRFDEHNMQALARLPSEDPRFFSDMFSFVSGQYRASMISFAGSVNHLDESWTTWLVQFEKLLWNLRAYSAVAHLVVETIGETDRRDYAFDATDALLNGAWTAWRSPANSTQSEEQVEMLWTPETQE